MNIQKTQGAVKKSFEFNYLDTDGNICADTVSLSIKRLSHRKAISDEFEALYDGSEKNRERVAEIICDTLESWNLEKDDKGTPLEITKDNALDLDAGLAKRISDAIIEVMAPNFQTAKN